MLQCLPDKMGFDGTNIPVPVIGENNAETKQTSREGRRRRAGMKLANSICIRETDFTWRRLELHQLENS